MFINYEGQYGEIIDREFDYFTRLWHYVVRWQDGTIGKAPLLPTLLVEEVPACVTSANPTTVATVTATTAN